MYIHIYLCIYTYYLCACACVYVCTSTESQEQFNLALLVKSNNDVCMYVQAAKSSQTLRYLITSSNDIARPGLAALEHAFEENGNLSVRHKMK